MGRRSVEAGLNVSWRVCGSRLCACVHVCVCVLACVCVCVLACVCVCVFETKDKSIIATCLDGLMTRAAC